MNMIEVRVDDLTGMALNWAVSIVEGHSISVSVATKRFYRTDVGISAVIPQPSTEWKQGGPLIQKYGVLLSPPKSMVHRNYGNFDERNGWYESGVWGATIFGKERKHRRRSFEHPDQPLVAAMRAIVQFELGDVVSVPAALVEGGAQ